MAPKKLAHHKAKGATTQAPSPPPDWPLFKPLLPRSQLFLETVIPSQIVVIRNFWTKVLCRDYVCFLKTLPLITMPRKPKKGDALRFNDRFQVHDDAFARRLWEETGLRDLVKSETADEVQERVLWGGPVIGLNPSIRIYRYSQGQFFDQHYDETNVVSLNLNGVVTPAKTTWTVLLYLTSPATGCQGGETVFYPDPTPASHTRGVLQNEFVVGLEVGQLLLHRHGDECMLHEGREVLEGEKWVIRTDLCVGV